MKPTISIIVPCYNQAQYLSECLQSVLAQTYTNWECLVINDGSTDDTENIAKYWRDKDKRIKYFYKENGGLVSSRNAGISIAEGEWILPLDADDKIGKNYLKLAYPIIHNDKNVGIIYCNAEFFGEKRGNWIMEPYSFKSLLSKNLIFCSALFKKNDWAKVGGYNSNMTYGYEDWEFWINLLHNTGKDVVKIDSVEFFYRIKENSMIKNIDKAKNEELILQIFKNHIPVYLKYFNPIRDHNEAVFYKAALQRIKSEKEYRLGSFFFFPINYIKRVLWRRKMKKENGLL